MAFRGILIPSKFLGIQFLKTKNWFQILVRMALNEISISKNSRTKRLANRGGILSIRKKKMESFGNVR